MTIDFGRAPLSIPKLCDTHEPAIFVSLTLRADLSIPAVGRKAFADLLSATLPGDGPIGEAWVLSDRDDYPSPVALLTS